MKKIDKISIYYFLSAIGISFINFLITESIIFSAILLTLFIIPYFVMLRKNIIDYKDNYQRTMYGINFIRDFLLNLSISNSLKDTYKKISIGFNDELKKQNEMMLSLNEVEKIEELEKYFNFNLYNYFSKIVKKYYEEGGNILKISNEYLILLDKEKLNLLKNENNKQTRSMEFIGLWSLIYLILVVLRFSLFNYFNQIISYDFYTISIFGFNVFFIFSLILFIKNYTNFDYLKGNNNYEKVQTNNKRVKFKFTKRNRKVNSN